MHRSNRIEAIRRSFWVLPAVAMALGVALALLLPAANDELGITIGLLGLTEFSAARGLLETIATVTVSVAGISFSITVVALQLAAQQLGPRVLRTFQRNRLSQAVLAMFLGTFVYALVLLTQLDATATEIPHLPVAVAIVATAVAFGLFVAFIDDTVTSLQAATVIERIAADGRRAIDGRHPGGAGEPVPDSEAALRDLSPSLRDREPGQVRASHGGFLVAVDGGHLVRVAERADGVIVQRAAIGDYVLTGGLLAEIWTDGNSHDPSESAKDAFALGAERAIPQDVAFPLRQLADVALRALSPSLNDPTTARNAVDAAADALVHFLRAEPIERVRADEHGAVRLVALGAEVDDLVRVAFEEVRRAAADSPTVTAHVAKRLDEIDRVARALGVDAAEVSRQRAKLVGQDDGG